MATLYRCETCGFVTESMATLAAHFIEHAQSDPSGTVEPEPPLPDGDGEC